MNVVLWVVQGVLAAIFLMAGVIKVTQSREKLLKQLPWVEDFSIRTVRFIGVMELLAAIGLILPALTGVAVFLTPLAATGLVVMMLLAVLTHIRRREPGAIVFTAVLMLAAAFVAWAGSARTRFEPPQPQTYLLLTTTPDGDFDACFRDD